MIIPASCYQTEFQYQRTPVVTLLLLLTLYMLLAPTTPLVLIMPPYNYCHPATATGAPQSLPPSSAASHTLGA